MVNIVSPIDISFKEWASQIRIDLPRVTFPIPPEVEKWRDWSSQVVNSNVLTNVPFPTKITYPDDDDWKKWAAYFINNMYN